MTQNHNEALDGFTESTAALAAYVDTVMALPRRTCPNTLTARERWASEPAEDRAAVKGEDLRDNEARR